MSSSSARCRAAWSTTSWAMSTTCAARERSTMGAEATEGSEGHSHPEGARPIASPGGRPSTAQRPEEPRMAREAELQIGVVVAHGAATVTLRGQLDVVSAPALQKAMRELVDGSQPRTLTVQMGDLAYLDSA